MNILEGKAYQRENRLSSALVTRDNARVLLMQNDETMRQQDHLATWLGKRLDHPMRIPDLSNLGTPDLNQSPIPAATPTPKPTDVPTQAP